MHWGSTAWHPQATAWPRPGTGLQGTQGDSRAELVGWGLPVHCGQLLMGDSHYSPD